MRRFFSKLLFLNFVFMFFVQPVMAENITFDNIIYNQEKRGRFDGTVIDSEYFPSGESNKSWTSKIEISYYPDVKNPIKYSNDEDDKIEKNDRCVLLKFIQNKKQDVAVISYLENVSDKGKNFFVYRVCKYEKYPDKGMIILCYSKRYAFITNNDIKNIAYEVKKTNDEYMDKLIHLNVFEIVNNENKKKTH